MKISRNADGVAIFEVTPDDQRPAWIIGPRSYLNDRFTAMPELVAQLPRSAPPMNFTAKIETTLSVSKSMGWKRRLLHKLQGHDRIINKMPGLVLDLRFGRPGNWFQSLCMDIPLLCVVCEGLQIAPNDLTLIMPERLGKVGRAVYELLGLNVQEDDRPIYARQVSVMEVARSTVFPYRRQALERSGFIDHIASMHRNLSLDVPKRIFLSRKSTRALTNEDEVEAFLSNLGYKKIYPEDLSPLTQIALFDRAEEIVAIHGAALAPMLYVTRGSALRCLVEILPVGHTVLPYRRMAQEVGVDWAGVRGHIKRQYLPGLYDLTSPFVNFSLDNFTVDCACLQYAIEIARAGIVPEFGHLTSIISSPPL